jgi:predicted nucleotidyltransferase component of viral defense system
MVSSPRQGIEMFHLVFLRALVAKGEDKSLISLKGGCNLRFYFGSIRYSEDIDLDVAVTSKETLRNKVERLLRSPLVTAPLKTRGLEIAEISSPKQTDTTQRWKLGLRSRGLELAVRTKIEFSRRDAMVGAAFEAVDPDVLRPHGLTPFLATHYTTHATVLQKVLALAGRTEPQARDVFDLNLLLARPEAHELELTDAEKRRLANAIDHAMGISFDEYASKVVAYLEPSQAELYGDHSSWEAMQEAVVSRLEAWR